jgi:hypothetical protein
MLLGISTFTCTPTRHLTHIKPKSISALTKLYAPIPHPFPKLTTNFPEFTTYFCPFVAAAPFVISAVVVAW